jgi:NitT/TauT family transport system substrate-binding protein
MLGSANSFADTSVKFQLDWRFEGPAAFFLLPLEKGYFKQAGLDVTVDAGNGSGNAVNRVASGTYDMGFADFSALMEFYGNNPDAPNKPVALMVVYSNTPATVMALKSSGIKSPADMTGKKFGAPGFDAGRRSFPLFQAANKVGAVNWISMEPALRETMLARGDIDAITGFGFTSLLNLEARGIKADDVVSFPYSQYGVKLYGNVIIATPKFIKENPAAVKGFLEAFTKGAKDVLANPDAAIEYVKRRDGIINVELEKRRLKMAIKDAINTPDAKNEGFGNASLPRVALMASQVSDVFNTKTRVNPDVVWNPSFLPSASARNIFPK